MENRKMGCKATTRQKKILVLVLVFPLRLWLVSDYSLKVKKLVQKKLQVLLLMLLRRWLALGDLQVLHSNQVKMCSISADVT